MVRTRVMVVDDNEPFGELLAEYLCSEGFEAKSFSQLYDLQDMIAWHPDVVLLDVQMPIMPGDEILRGMRTHPALRLVPVIMITGAPYLEADVLNMAQSWLSKPVDLLVLRDRINHVYIAGTPPAWSGQPESQGCAPAPLNGNCKHR